MRLCLETLVNFESGGNRSVDGREGRAKLLQDARMNERKERQ
jgi:hypothetical protein